MAAMAPREEWDEEEEQRQALREPLLGHLHSINLRRHARNSTSQIAIIGSNPCPIESLDYEMIESDLFNQDWRSRGRAAILQYIFLKWTLCFLIGILAAAVGFFNNLAIENLAGIKFVAFYELMLANRYWLAFGMFAASNLALLMFASTITSYISTAAGGSGIPEVKAYLNGVDAPDIFSLRTLVVKILGCITAVSSSLHVGKAGPMVHTGACIAALLGHGGSRRFRMTCKWLRYFKNDRDRRDLVTCGAAAGVAAAFRAPVGGVLFALESLSSWWRSALIWRAFFTTAVVAVVLQTLINICNSGKCGLFGKGGLIMFDVTSDSITYHLTDLPPVILLGVIGGILGSLYNFLMLKVLRIYSLVNEKGCAHKLLLSATVSIFTSCCLFGLPWLASCRPCPKKDCPSIGHSGNYKQFRCPPMHYNDLAGLIFNTNDDAIRNLFTTGTNDELHRTSILLFFVASYILGILSYGVVAPFGLFVPIILTGAIYGRFVGMLTGSSSNLDHGLFAILGSASFLGGTMRMTVSMCVIILELTNNLLLLPLVMLVLLISKTVADSFNANIYDQILKLKGLPYLEGHAEPYMRQLTVSDVVTGPLQTFNGVEKVGNIVHALRTTGHHGFPVIDDPPFSSSPVLFGLILRAHLLVLLKKKDFLPTCSRSGADASKMFMANDFAKRSSGKHDRVEDIELTAEEMEMFIDLHPFTNTSPYTVVETMSLAKALILFREVGLRHLLVVPKSSPRAPVVGILTRHDFMPEHILGLHPYLMRSRWKRLRISVPALKKYFRGFLMWACT
ncbi:putative chloride channel-like protein CLC-g isoform X1 [Phoenix dactylifera]|uniref:Chloride channel protein n=1 Tax=Phoenix dactylifera TaxID=42345 RepID=A0A8B7C002_PHODC|nr:putative chloride channel-like protein CLC-g isoform X1 [Phoenix dactylifera]